MQLLDSAPVHNSHVKWQAVHIPRLSKYPSLQTHKKVKKLISLVAEQVVHLTLVVAHVKHDVEQITHMLVPLSK